MLFKHVARLVRRDGEQLAAVQINARGHAAAVHVIHHLAVADAKEGVDDALLFVPEHGGDAHGIDGGGAHSGHFLVLHEQLFEHRVAHLLDFNEEIVDAPVPVRAFKLHDALPGRAFQRLIEHLVKRGQKRGELHAREVFVRPEPCAAKLAGKEGVELRLVVKKVPVGLIVHPADDVVGYAARDDGFALLSVQLIHRGDFIVHVARVVPDSAIQHVKKQPHPAFF